MSNYKQDLSRVTSFLSLNVERISDTLNSMKFGCDTFLYDTSKDVGMSLKSSQVYLDTLQEKYGWMDHYGDLSTLEYDEDMDDFVLEKVFDFEEIKKLAYLIQTDLAEGMKRRLENII